MPIFLEQKCSPAVQFSITKHNKLWLFMTPIVFLTFMGMQILSSKLKKSMKELFTVCIRMSKEKRTHIKQNAQICCKCDHLEEKNTQKKYFGFSDLFEFKLDESVWVYFPRNQKKNLICVWCDFFDILRIFVCTAQLESPKNIKY